MADAACACMHDKNKLVVRVVALVTDKLMRQRL